jgi:hypothetical protein
MLQRSGGKTRKYIVCQGTNHDMCNYCDERVDFVKKKAQETRRNLTPIFLSQLVRNNATHATFFNPK